MSPDIISAIAGSVSAVVTLVTAIFVVRQIKEMKKSTHASSFKTVCDILQNQQNREARGFVLNVLQAKPFDDWSEEDIKIAEKVCESYDSVGIMCKHEYIELKVIADSWGDSLRKTWKILSPLVSKYRVNRNSKEFWDDYEWLARESEKYQQRIYAQ